MADFHTGKDHLFANGNKNILKGNQGDDVLKATGTGNKLNAQAAASGEHRVVTERGASPRRAGGDDDASPFRRRAT